MPLPPQSLPQGAPSFASPERILVIRLGALGDLVLCFQAFHEIRQAYPEADIALLTMPSFAAFGAHMPWFNRVLSDERAPLWRIDQWWTLVRRVRDFAPTRVFDLQGKTRQTVLYFLADGATSQWSGAAPGCSYPRLWPPEKGMHFIDFLAAQLSRAQVPKAGAADLSWLDAPFDDSSVPARFALFIPGCGPGRDYKKWPAGKYAALARRLSAEGIGAVAVGTKADAVAVSALCDAAPDVVDLSGRTDLLQLGSLARRALFVVGNDTGPTHLSAAVGAPTLALLSDQVDPLWSAPRGPHAAFLQGHPLDTLEVEKVFLALKMWVADKS